MEIDREGTQLFYSTDDENIARKYGEEMPVSRIMVNTLASIGAVGGTTGLVPSMTLGCGSYGGNITSRHLLNIKRLAYGIKEVEIPVPLFSTRQESQKVLSNEEKVAAIITEVIKSMKQTHTTIDENEVAKLVTKILVHQQNH